MVQSYNYLTSWQLFHHQKELSIQINWITPDNEAFFSQCEIRSEILNASTIEIDSLISPDAWGRVMKPAAEPCFPTTN